VATAPSKAWDVLSTHATNPSTPRMGQPVKKKDNLGPFSRHFAGLPDFSKLRVSFSKTGHVRIPSPDAILLNISTFPRVTVTTAG